MIGLLLGTLYFFAAYWWLLIISSLAVGVVTALVALMAPKVVGGEPKSMGALKTSMALTAISIVLAGIGVFIGTAYLIGYIFGIPMAGSATVIGAAFITLIIILAQWLLSPLVIKLVYKAHPPRTDEERRYQEALKEVAERSGIKTPKLMIAETYIPNAFSYGSPISGSYVAVTRGLLNMMPFDEIRSVLGHEVGHLKHRDVGWLLALSVIPLAIYYLGQMLIFNGILGWGYGEGEGRGRGGNGGLGAGALLALVGIVLVAAGVMFRFLVGNFNRLREYYADANSAMVTSPRGIQRALARLHVAIKGERYLSRQANSSAISALKPLFIIAPFVEINGGFLYEPDEDAWPWGWRRQRPDLSRYRNIDIDEVVERVKQEKTDPVEEVFSTHPPIPKRLRFIDNIKYYVNPVEP